MSGHVMRIREGSSLEFLDTIAALPIDIADVGKVTFERPVDQGLNKAQFGRLRGSIMVGGRGESWDPKYGSFCSRAIDGVRNRWGIRKRKNLKTPILGSVSDGSSFANWSRLLLGLDEILGQHFDRRNSDRKTMLAHDLFWTNRSTARAFSKEDVRFQLAKAENGASRPAITEHQIGENVVLGFSYLLQSRWDSVVIPTSIIPWLGTEAIHPRDTRLVRLRGYEKLFRNDGLYESRFREQLGVGRLSAEFQSGFESAFLPEMDIRAYGLTKEHGRFEAVERGTSSRTIDPIGIVDVRLLNFLRIWEDPVAEPGHPWIDELSVGLDRQSSRVAYIATTRRRIRLENDADYAFRIDLQWSADVRPRWFA